MTNVQYICCCQPEPAPQYLVMEECEFWQRVDIETCDSIGQFCDITACLPPQQYSLRADAVEFVPLPDDIIRSRWSGWNYPASFYNVGGYNEQMTGRVVNFSNDLVGEDRTRDVQDRVDRCCDGHSVPLCEGTGTRFVFNIDLGSVTVVDTHPDPDPDSPYTLCESLQLTVVAEANRGGPTQNARQCHVCEWLAFYDYENPTPGIETTYDSMTFDVTPGSGDFPGGATNTGYTDSSFEMGYRANGDWLVEFTDHQPDRIVPFADFSGFIFLEGSGIFSFLARFEGNEADPCGSFPYSGPWRLVEFSISVPGGPLSFAPWRSPEYPPLYADVEFPPQITGVGASSASILCSQIG